MRKEQEGGRSRKEDGARMRNEQEGGRNRDKEREEGERN